MGVTGSPSAYNSSPRARVRRYYTIKRRYIQMVKKYDRHQYYENSKEYYSKKSSEQYRKNKELSDKYGISVAQIIKYGIELALHVYSKCNWKCSDCGEITSLAIHHKDHNGRNNKEAGLEENNSPDNLTLMCIKCHGSYHATKYWEERKALVV
jgi:hypothetical protein